VLRQVSTMTAALAQLVADRGVNALDNGSVAVLRDALAATIVNRAGDTMTGTLAAPQLQVATDFYMVMSGANPAIAFDSSDFISYDRANNYFNFYAGGSNVLYIGPGDGPARTFDATTANGLPRLSQLKEMAPRAVVTFNGFDGGIWYSRGVSSVTKISTGCYEINFSSPMPSANYGMFGSATESDGVTISTSNPGGNNHIAGCGLAGTVSVKTVNKMRVYCFEAAGSPATVGPEDASFISVCFIGG
jgi:hypothetical protein